MGWVILALVCCQAGVVIHRPSTQFDLQSCMREAAQINQEWRATHFTGLATCQPVRGRRVQSDDQAVATLYAQ